MKTSRLLGQSIFCLFIIIISAAIIHRSRHNKQKLKDLPIRIVYYKEGAIKSQFDSLDKIAAPFIIDGQPNSLNILNTPIYFKIMSPRKVAFNWTLNYQSYSDTLEHSPWIKNEFFNLEVHVAPMIPQEKMSANYYFIFK